jgi:superfamily II DNA or RNA helicase
MMVVRTLYATQALSVDKGMVATLAHVPTGYGKKLIILFLAQLWLEHHPDHWVIILVTNDYLRFHMRIDNYQIGQQPFASKLEQHRRMVVAAKHQIQAVDTTLRRLNIDKKNICLIVDEVDAIMTEGFFL